MVAAIVVLVWASDMVLARTVPRIGCLRRKKHYNTVRNTIIEDIEVIFSAQQAIIDKQKEEMFGNMISLEKEEYEFIYESGRDWHKNER